MLQRPKLEFWNSCRTDFVCNAYFEENNVSMHQGTRGLASNAFHENVPTKFKDKGDAISNSTTESEWNLGGLPSEGFITADIYTSFVLLVGIFFPSCTGTPHALIKCLNNNTFSSQCWKITQKSLTTTFLKFEMRHFWRFFQHFGYSEKILWSLVIQLSALRARLCIHISLELEIYSE